MTYRAVKLDPPRINESAEQLFKWRQRVFELLNGINTILGDGIEITPSGDITGSTLQTAINQTGALIPGHTAATDPHSGYQLESGKGVASGYAGLDANATVPDDQISADIARDVEVVAAIDAHEAETDPHPGYLTPAEGDAAYAPIAKGVTNGDSHDHSGGDGAQVDHAGLANIGTNTHAQIDTKMASLTGLSVYANNAAAIAGGLVAGKYYRTGADPDPVMVVH